MPEYQIPDEFKEVYKKVEKEFLAYLRINADFSGGQEKKGVYFEKKGDLALAKEAFIEALKIDINNNIVRTNLGNIYYWLGDTLNAEKASREVIRQEPEFGFTHYSLALLLTELARMDDALIEMEKPYKLVPSNVRVLYNLSLLYDKQGKIKEAENTFLQGLWLEPENEDLLYALAFHYLKQKQKQEALKTVDKLAKLYPNKPEY